MIALFMKKNSLKVLITLFVLNINFVHIFNLCGIYLTMEFVETVKNLRNEYLNTIKLYYKDKNIIFKMFYNRVAYDTVCAGELAFRSCMVKHFKDDRLNDILARNPQKGMEVLTNRAFCCLYTVSIINDLICDSKQIKEQDKAYIEKLQQIKSKLCDLAQCSLDRSNKISQENKLPIYTSNINIDEYRK